MPHRLCCLGTRQTGVMNHDLVEKRLGWKVQILGRLCLDIARTRVNCVEVWWWMALLILLNCCFFQPTCKNNIPSYPTKQKTCKLTTSYLYTWILNQPNKPRFFHWISALKPTTKVLQMDTAERGAPDFQWKNQYDNDIFLVDSPSTAASQLVAATLPHGAGEPS